jgi:transcriptional regulator with XRE-family HTH domain
MSEICEIFGRKLRMLRKEQNLTQAKFAQKCGLHTNYIGMIERGERNPSLKNLEVIANAFDISLSELMKF